VTADQADHLLERRETIVQRLAFIDFFRSKRLLRSMCDGARYPASSQRFFKNAERVFTDFLHIRQKMAKAFHLAEGLFAQALQSSFLKQS
jgi:hypothetical protein